MERLCHTNLFTQIGWIHLIANYITGATEEKQHERRKNYINSHIQIQIAVNISIDWVNLFVWHKQNLQGQMPLDFAN